LNRTTKIICAVAALAALGSACDSVRELVGSDSAEAPEARQIELDEKAAYVYRDLDMNLRHAQRLDEVPVGQRGAVIVHVDGERAGEDAVYVANLLEASPGDTVSAHKMSRRDHFQHARAAVLGNWHARMVDFAARERAQFDPRSERSDASRKAKKMMDDLTQSKKDHEAPQ
jgi:hypothetical protein